MQQVRKLVSKKELKTVHGIPYSFAHIARLEKAGEFPKRIQLGACRVAWWEDEVEDWKLHAPEQINVRSLCGAEPRRSNAGALRFGPCRTSIEMIQSSTRRKPVP